ncbi:hypothetical protein PMAYCL1PPCAC_29642, partial [Pristionchus mayeri]
MFSMKEFRTSSLALPCNIRVLLPFLNSIMRGTVETSHSNAISPAQSILTLTMTTSPSLTAI